MDQPSSSSSIRLGGRAIDRHNPIIHDGRRFTPPPSPNPKSISSSLHQSPSHKTKRKNKKGYYVKEKSSDGSGKSPMGCFSSDTPQGSSRYLLGNNNNPVFYDGFVDSDPVPIPIEPEITGVEFDELEEDRVVINASKYASSSSSFLEKKQPDFFEGFLDYDPVLSPDHPFTEPMKASPTTSLSSLEDKDVSSPDFNSSPPPPPPPPPLSSPSSPLPPAPEKAPSSDQVVVLRVSLHCKGCAGKVKKHLSKMKGVTSFNIDFAAKKVTVTGDVTPLTVLNTISKVKNAQFWPEIIPK